MRVLDELANSRETPAAELVREPDLDPGCLSCILGGFRWRTFVRETVSGMRAAPLFRPTPAGQDAFAPLQERFPAEVGKLLTDIPASDRYHDAATGAMERLLNPPTATPVPYLLCPAGAKSEAPLNARRRARRIRVGATCNGGSPGLDRGGTVPPAWGRRCTTRLPLSRVTPLRWIRSRGDAIGRLGLATALVALDASELLRAATGGYTVAATDFFAPPTDDRRTETLLVASEMIMDVRVPPQPAGVRSTCPKGLGRKV